jgi:hypothetical protein
MYGYPTLPSVQQRGQHQYSGSSGVGRSSASEVGVGVSLYNSNSRTVSSNNTSSQQPAGGGYSSMYSSYNAERSGSTMSTTTSGYQADTRSSGYQPNDAKSDLRASGYLVSSGAPAPQPLLHGPRDLRASASSIVPSQPPSQPGSLSMQTDTRSSGYLTNDAKSDLRASGYLASTSAHQPLSQGPRDLRASASSILPSQPPSQPGSSMALEGGAGEDEGGNKIQLKKTSCHAQVSYIVVEDTNVVV